jgi:hypothetical protein
VLEEQHHGCRHGRRAGAEGVSGREATVTVLAERGSYIAAPSVSPELKYRPRGCGLRISEILSSGHAGRALRPHFRLVSREPGIIGPPEIKASTAGAASKGQRTVSRSIGLRKRNSRLCTGIVATQAINGGRRQERQGGKQTVNRLGGVITRVPTSIYRNGNGRLSGQRNRDSTW